MRASLFDRSARKQTVSLTVNGDLFAKAKQAGLNASGIAEQALADALAQRRAEQIKTEIRQDLAAYNRYVARHGSPAAMARDHFVDRDDAV
jgi:antitoxin CcdA